MPKVSKEPVAPEFSPSLSASIHGRASRAMLEKIYHCTSSFCCGCGTHLSTNWGEPLGRYFIMDNNGRFYCATCDKQFEDNDERIYVPEEDML